jgi:electron transfer flavoprotein alpha subunit
VRTPGFIRSLRRGEPRLYKGIMDNTILVVVEQREGKLNRVSWETIAAGQAIAAQTGWTLEAAVVGSGVAGHRSRNSGEESCQGV